MSRSSILFSILFLLFQFSYSQPTNESVEVGGFYYSPNILEIEVGSTVTWTNVGGLHDVNGLDNSITGDSFNNPEDFYLGTVYSAGSDSPVVIGSYTFTVPGTYTYDCSVGTHAEQGMVAQIIVTYVSYPGCMDELACNYDMTANEDDGSCIFNGNDVNGEANGGGFCCEALTPECLACAACKSN